MAQARSSSQPVVAQPGIPSDRPHWYRNLWLPLLTIILLTLAFPPISQFYLAWIALVPWLIFVQRTRSPFTAFIASMFMGWILYIVNMYWLWKVTIPGWLALTWYMSLYWSVGAVVVRGLLRRFPPTRYDHGLALTAAIPTLFVALEYIRGNLWTGIPYLNLSHTQTPLLVMCQIADIFGAYGVTFLLVAVNVFLAMAILSRRPRRQQARATFLIPACVLVLLLLAASFFYGLYRMAQAVHRPGPVITVIQANFPQSDTGAKGATEEQIVDFHIKETAHALQGEFKKGIRPDLVVWSETMMPPINPEACALSPVLQRIHDRIAAVARDYDVSILTGGVYWAKFREIKGEIAATDRRNSAYFFSPLGQLSHQRYDKIHLVPFGEYIPFKHSVPILYNLLYALFNPYGYDYTLSPGNPNDLTVFSVSEHEHARPTRFVVPICFEDLDSALVARMFRGPRNTKRADMFVTITNDGWFTTPELSQHLAVAQFRCIENRVPAARSVNTGLSGFIDSVGRTHNLLPAHVSGAATAQPLLDPRVTIYTQWGDWFAVLCTEITGFVCLWLLYTVARRPILMGNRQ